MRKRPAPVSSISKTRRVCLHNRNNAGRFVFVSWQTRRAVSAALLHSLALCPNTSKTRPKTRQKRPKTGANVVLFRRNLLNFCILLIRPKRGQTKRRARRLLSGGWSTLHTGRAKHAPRFYHTAGGVEALPRVLVSTFRPFRSYDTPLVSTFWRFRTYERRAGRLHHTAGRIQIQARRPRFRPWFVDFLYFGRGAALFALSFARGGRLQSTAAGCLFLHTAKPQHAAPCALPPYCFSLPLPLRD